MSDHEAEIRRLRMLVSGLLLFAIGKKLSPAQQFIVDSAKREIGLLPPLSQADLLATRQTK